MKLIYNDIEMEMFELQSFTREAVYSQDGVDLLYIKYRMTALLTVGPGGRPAAVSARRPISNRSLIADTKASVAQRNSLRSGSPVIDPAANTFTNPAEVIQAGAAAVGQPNAFMSDHEMKLRLMMPRKRLLITAFDPATGDEKVWVKAPKADQRTTVIGGTRDLIGGTQSGGPSGSQLGLDLPTSSRVTMPYSDAANGPTPLACDVVGACGEGGSMGFLYTIEYNLVPTYMDTEKLILSHRWEVTHASDEDYYLVRETTGIVVGNGELLRGFGIPLDWVQQEFFHPIPLGYVRSLPIVKMSGDGLTMMYTIRDRDPEIMFDPGDSGATHIDIQETVNLLNPDPQAAMIAAFKMLGPVAGGAIFGTGFIVNHLLKK